MTHDHVVPDESSNEFELDDAHVIQFNDNDPDESDQDIDDQYHLNDRAIDFSFNSPECVNEPVVLNTNTPDSESNSGSLETEIESDDTNLLYPSGRLRRNPVRSQRPMDDHYVHEDY